MNGGCAGCRPGPWWIALSGLEMADAHLVVRVAAVRKRLFWRVPPWQPLILPRGASRRTGNLCLGNPVSRRVIGAGLVVLAPRRLTKKGRLPMSAYAETSARVVDAGRRRVAMPLLMAVGCICVFLLIPAGICDEPAGEPLDPTRFLADYRKAVQELRATYLNVRIDGTVRIVQTIAPAQKSSTSEQKAKAPGRPRPSGSDRQFDFSYASCDGKEKGRRAPFGSADSGRAAVAVDNGNIQFTASRMDPGRPYVINYHSRDDGDMKPLAELRAQVRDAPYRPSGLEDFEKYLGSPDFSIERARRVPAAGGAVVSLLVHYRPAAQGAFHIDGRLDLDESLGLVIRQYELQHSMALSSGLLVWLYEGTVQYKQENGKAIPTHVDLKTYPTKEPRRSTRWEYDISKYSLEFTPPKEFTLDFYGLGDFERTLNQAETRSAFRSAAVAAVAFLIGFILFGIGRKMHKGGARASTGAQPG